MRALSFFMVFTDTQIKRYSRHLALAEIGTAGQEALLDSSVLIIGAGGLGGVASLYLAAAGVGRIAIMDGDSVELSNLQRQIIYSIASLGEQKAVASECVLRGLNDDVLVQPYPFYADHESLEKVIGGYDIIADCSDNFETRFLVADMCARYKKPLVSAAVSEFEGQISTFKPYLGGAHPSYRCFCPREPKDVRETCSSGGILGSVVGVMGTLQATEIIKEITEVGEGLSGVLLRYRARDCEFSRSVIKRSVRATI